MAKSKIRRQLKAANSVATSTFYDEVVPCAAGEEIEIVSVRFGVSLDATVASRLYQISFGERDGSISAEQFAATQLSPIAANNVGVVQFVQGVNSEQVYGSAVEVFVQVQLPRVRFSAPVRLRVIAYGGQAGDVAGPVDVRWLVRGPE